MQRFRFIIAVGVTSLALVLVLVGVGAFAVRNVLASGSWLGGPGFGGHRWAQHELQIPTELQGLHDLPPAERFGHFVGAQINLRDKEGRPLAVNATPGTVTAVSATSLTTTANDGTIKTYALDDKTVVRGKPVQGADQASQPSLSRDDKVVVVTLNNSTTANAVIVGGPDGFGGHGPRGPFWRQSR